MPGKKIKEIPVYIFMGFLGSGKTTFAKDILIKQGFTEGAPTLLLMCEDGEEEYDEKQLKKRNITVAEINDDNLTEEYLAELSDKYHPENVVIEYNGMWELDKIFNVKVPAGWTVVQVISFVDASTYDMYMSNMRKIIMDQIRNADMIIFNRCEEDTKASDYKRGIRAVNRRAQVIFEKKDGKPLEFEEEAFIPYNLDADVVEIGEDDFGIFYLDSMNNPDKYIGKKVRFKAMAHRPANYGNKEFVTGRFIMTCCEADIEFYGMKCKYAGAGNIKDRDFVIVEGTLKKEYYKEIEGDGPVIYADSVTLTSPSERPYITFDY